MQIAALGGAADLFTSGRARDIADTRSQGRENWIEVLDCLRLAANHQAVTALAAPDAAARAHVHVMNSFRRELLGAANIVDVIGIAAVDQNVAGIEVRQEIRDGLIHRRGGY